MERSKKRFLTRVLPVLAAVVLMVGSCLTVCAEVTTNYTINDVLQAIKDSGKTVYTYSFMYKYDSDYYVITTTSECTLTNNISSVQIFTDGSYCCYRVTDVENKYISNISSTPDYVYFYSSSSGLIKMSYSNLQSNFIESNYDVFDSEGNVVFRGPVPPLVRVAEAIAPETVQKEIISLIPLLIPCLVGYLALRKGLRFLSSILRAA